LRPYLEKTHHKERAGEVAQSVGTEFKHQYCKKKKKKMAMPLCITHKLWCFAEPYFFHHLVSGDDIPTSK
jgi:hypothetical protein